ncbi:MAG: hypothetical protein K5663_12860, partial [Clostridiales bacterium]|nr:hypothetical protein [Clostridiales bacterium]
WYVVFIVHFCGPVLIVLSIKMDLGFFACPQIWVWVQFICPFFGEYFKLVGCSKNGMNTREHLMNT